jgi:hypothetical protein
VSFFLDDSEFGVPASTWHILEDSLGWLSLHGEGSSIYTLTFDPGTALHRENVEDVVGQSGESDLTAYHSGRLAVSTLRFVGSFRERHYWWNQLAAYTRPDLRPELYWQRPGVGPLLARGRVKLAGSIQPAGRALVAQLTMRVGLGVWLDAELLREAIVRPGLPSSSGRVYPLVFPRLYTAGTGGATVLMFAGGSTYSTPIIRIFGPGVDPSFVIQSASGAADGLWTFDGLTLLAGDYVEIDVERGTVLLNGNPATPRYDLLDFSTLRWGLLVPGDNEAALEFASGTDSNSQAIVYWRNAYI